MLLQEQSGAMLCQHRMSIHPSTLAHSVDTYCFLHGILAGAFTQLTSGVWLRSSYDTRVISSQSGQLVFPTDLY